MIVFLMINIDSKEVNFPLDIFFNILIFFSTKIYVLTYFIFE